jgi:hypothetical protein
MWKTSALSHFDSFVLSRYSEGGVEVMHICWHRRIDCCGEVKRALPFYPIHFIMTTFEIPKTCKAAVMVNEGPDFSVVIEEVPVPSPGMPCDPWEQHSWLTPFLRP